MDYLNLETQLKDLEKSELELKSESAKIQENCKGMKSMLELITRAVDEKKGQFKLKLQHLAIFHQLQQEEYEQKAKKYNEEHKKLQFDMAVKVQIQADEVQRDRIKALKLQDPTHQNQITELQLENASLYEQIEKLQRRLDELNEIESLDSFLPEKIKKINQQIKIANQKKKATNDRISELHKYAFLRKKEREKQLEDRRELQNKIDEVSRALTNEEQLTDEGIKELLKDDEIIASRDVKKQIKSVKTLIQIMHQKKEEAQARIELICDKKGHIQEKIYGLKQGKKSLEDNKNFHSNDIHNKKAKAEVMDSHIEQKSKKYQETKEKINQFRKGIIPNQIREIESLQEKIIIQEHQLNLANLIRSFNLPENSDGQCQQEMKRILMEIQKQLTLFNQQNGVQSSLINADANSEKSSSKSSQRPSQRA